MKGVPGQTGKKNSRYLKGICQIVFHQWIQLISFFSRRQTHIPKKLFSRMKLQKVISNYLPGRCSLFAKNYDSRFVPVPLDDPMGRVVSGIACFPKFRPGTAERIDYGTRFSWPKQLALLTMFYGDAVQTYYRERIRHH